MKIEIPQGKRILVFTGPESSGKTTCAELLAKKHDLPLIKEYAREYLEMHGPEYTFEDLVIIANEQLRRQSQAFYNYDFILCDTDLLTIKIWANEKYGKDIGISISFQDQKHYMLCVPDIPWAPDPLRENPVDRDRLFSVYENELKNMGATYTVLDQDARSQLQLSRRK